MKYTAKHLFLLLFIFFSTSLLSQEICDNAIDDDNDGLIDLNDPDCECFTFAPSSLIPNPSFEEMSCCPSNEAELECADEWIQASPPTTDYYHTCDLLAHPFLGFMVPLPIIDGEGAIGFRDGKTGQPNFKEYAGACLTESMTVGVEYMLDFYVGFHDAPGSDVLNMAVFATTDCNNLPFGNNSNFGCPTNGPGWVQLGSMTYSGVNEWVDVEFEFVADQAYEAIVLGPDCAINPDIDDDPYFFFDDLVLAESVMFGVPLMTIEGDICTDNLVLTTSDTIVGAYQWYKDGVAILGETGSSLSITNDGNAAGIYEVVVTNDEGCFNGEQYEVIVPVLESSFEDTFCEGSSYIFGDLELTSPGEYEQTFISSVGCDSIVSLTLESLDAPSESITVEMCDGDSYTLNDVVYTEGGEYEQTLTTVDGCDSLLTLNLILLENSESSIFAEACEGDVYSLNNEDFTESGIYTQNLFNVLGCDSTLTLEIAFYPNTTENIAASICNGDTYQLNNETYSEAGIYEQNLTNSMGCDSLLILNLEVNEVYFEDIFASICEGDIFELNGIEYTEAGTFDQELISSENCDSILVIQIALEENPSENLAVSICEGESININEISYTEVGNFQQTLEASNGCDSTLIIQISVLENSSDTIQVSICEDESYNFFGEQLTTSGEYSETLTNAVGCDSLVVLMLESLANSSEMINLDICEGEEVDFNGTIYNTEGEFLQTLEATNGCDSSIFITVDVILNCDDCRYDEEQASRQMSLTIKNIDDKTYDARIILLNEEIMFAGISRDRMFALVALYALEKERLLTKPSKFLVKDHLNIVNAGQWEFNTQIDKQLLNQRFTINSSVLSEIEIERVNGIYHEVLNMASSLRKSKQCYYR